MARILLRTLTRKSKLGFGKYKERTVQQLIDSRQLLQLISAYYKLTTINYMDDILEELNITEEFRIKKPSSDKDLYYKFLNAQGYEKRKRGVGSDKLKKQTKVPSRNKLMGKNHGR